MNIYIRYFDTEAVVSDLNEVFAFLNELNIEDFVITEEIFEDMRSYIESSVNYPKRYKVKQHNYFILIKTNATTLQEFKSNNVKSILEETANPAHPHIGLNDEQKGWYDATLKFKRVICAPETGKAKYKDCDIRVLLKADSVSHCYERIVQYLKQRPDIDARSQYPSAKGKYFSYNYLGETKPSDIDALITA